MNKLFVISILILLNTITYNPLSAMHQSPSESGMVPTPSGKWEFVDPKEKREEERKLYASEEYTRELHQQIINPDSSRPPLSQPELRTLQGHAIAQDRSTWRTPLSHEPLEDCREHATRLKVCRDREKWKADLGAACQTERQNVMSCLKDPRSREYRLEAAAKMRPPITIIPSLDEAREQCAREHLGFARHLNPSWIPVIAGQAAVDSHAACVARVEYSEVELKEKVQRERQEGEFDEFTDPKQWPARSIAQRAASDKKPKAPAKSTSAKPHSTEPKTQEDLKKRAVDFVYEIRQAREQMLMATDAAIRAAAPSATEQQIPATPKQPRAPSYVLRPTVTGSYRPVALTEQDEQFYNTLDRFGEIGEGVGSGISFFGGDKRTAHFVKNSTRALVKTIGSFYSGDVCGFMSGCNDLKESFDELNKEDEASPTQMILQEIYESIQALSRQMAENHAQVMKRFDRVDKMLEHEQRLIIQGFFNLHQETGDIKQAIRKLGERAAQQHAQLQANVAYNTQLMSSGHAMLTDSLASLRIEDIHEIVEDAREDADRKELAAKDFVHHTKRLTRKAVTRAAEPHLTGGKVETTDMSAIQAALKKPKSKKLWEHPAFANINLLSNYAAQRCKTKATTLVNPLIWSQCADMVLKLFRKKMTDKSYPSSQEQQAQDMEHLAKLHQEGKKIRKFVQKLDKAGCIHEIVKDYTQKLQQLAAVIKERQTTYEAERTHELCVMHRKTTDAEAVTLSTMPVECPECVKLTNITWHTFKNLLGTGPIIKMFLNNSITFANKKNGVLTKQLYDAKQLSDILNPCEPLKNRVKKHIKNIRENGLHTLAQIQLNAADCITQLSSYGRTIYPVDSEQNKVILLIDESQLDLEIQFMQTEQLGLGTIRYEYVVKDNMFNLYGYYCSNDSKIMIAHKQLPYESSSLYSNDENIQHFWYGGRFPKEKDIVVGISQFTRIPCTWGYYPPENAFPSAQDTFKVTAKDIYVPPSGLGAYQLAGKQITNFYAQERIKFCKRIAAEAEPSTKSKVFKTIQELDVQFKLLDSFLTFMYNELMYASKDALHPQFAALHDSTVTYLRDEEAMSRYFDEYAQPSSALAQQEFALAHIKQTQEAIEKTFQGILGLKLQAGFAQVVNVLNGLREVMALYQGRVITPVKINTEVQELVVTIKQLQQQHDKEIAQRDKQIVLLAQDKEVLAKTVTETRQEIGAMREQMKQLMEMMTKMQTRA